MPHLDQILIYPIKSLDGVSVRQATVLTSGALQHDREFAIVDLQGKVVNGKRTPKIHGLRSTFDLDGGMVSLQRHGEGQPETFPLMGDRTALETWLGNYFGFPVQVIQDQDTGFPDDLLSPGPTIISTATLNEVATWFPGVDFEGVRSRFRTNLEIAGVEPFWEDRLFSNTDEGVRFQVGAVEFEGVNPCQRCIVPVRDALTGQPYANFQKTFTQQRQATLPAWAAAARFNHFYRLAVNTRLGDSRSQRVLQVGDEIIS